MNSLGMIGVIGFFGLILYVGLKFKKKVMQEEMLKLEDGENSYTFIYEAKEWGPEIQKIIINAVNLSDFTAEDLNPESFNVTVQTETNNLERKVTKAWFCTYEGAPIDSYEENARIVLEFDVNAYDANFSPYNIIKDNGNSYNQWKDSYEYTVSHPKLSEDIILSNIPILEEEASRLCKKMGLPA